MTHWLISYHYWFGAAWERLRQVSLCTKRAELNDKVDGNCLEEGVHFCKDVGFSTHSSRTLRDTLNKHNLG